MHAFIGPLSCVLLSMLCTASRAACVDEMDMRSCSLRLHTPQCPEGNQDITNGNAYYWECCTHCPGDYWCTIGCCCACQLFSQDIDPGCYIAADPAANIRAKAAQGQAWAVSALQEIEAGGRIVTTTTTTERTFSQGSLDDTGVGGKEKISTPGNFETWQGDGSSSGQSGQSLSADEGANEAAGEATGETITLVFQIVGGVAGVLLLSCLGYFVYAFYYAKEPDKHAAVRMSRGLSRSFSRKFGKGSVLSEPATEETGPVNGNQAFKDPVAMISMAHMRNHSPRPSLQGSPRQSPRPSEHELHQAAAGAGHGSQVIGGAPQGAPMHLNLPGSPALHGAHTGSPRPGHRHSAPAISPRPDGGHHGSGHHTHQHGGGMHLNIPGSTAGHGAPSQSPRSGHRQSVPATSPRPTHSPRPDGHRHSVPATSPRPAHSPRPDGRSSGHHGSGAPHLNIPGSTAGHGAPSQSPRPGQRHSVPATSPRGHG